MKITPAHPAIAAYHEALHNYATLNVTHEMGLRGAFQGLLDTTARNAAGWTLVPEQGSVIL